MDYQFYRLNDAERIVSAINVVADDDQAALQQAAQICENYAVEIWQGGRYVAQVRPGNAPLEA